MRRLTKPSTLPSEVFDSCVSGLTDEGTRDRFHAARQLILQSYAFYDHTADPHSLYTLESSAWGNPQQIVLAGITKGEFNELYDQMSHPNKPGRRHYQAIKNSAPLFKCPYCCIGQIESLDHFLSKAYYPAYSVLNFNLVPACFSCNHRKGSSVVSQVEEQALHPYYEPLVIETEAWLFARVVVSNPPEVTFFVQCPEHWPPDLCQRTENHFDGLELAARFGVEAYTDIIPVAETMRELSTIEDRRDHLNTISRKERSNRTNTCKAALYEALASSDWFITTGYILVNNLNMD